MAIARARGRWVCAGCANRLHAMVSYLADQARTEKAVFDTVASFPKTASEVAANLQGSASRQTNAATILEGLVRRGVLARRPGSSPAVYEAPEPLEEAA